METLKLRNEILTIIRTFDTTEMKFIGLKDNVSKFQGDYNRQKVEFKKNLILDKLNQYLLELNKNGEINKFIDFYDSLLKLDKIEYEIYDFLKFYQSKFVELLNQKQQVFTELIPLIKNLTI